MGKYQFTPPYLVLWSLHQYITGAFLLYSLSTIQEFYWIQKSGCHCITHKQKAKTSDASPSDDIWKHCVKRRKFAISPFATVFPTPFSNNTYYFCGFPYLFPNVFKVICCRYVLCVKGLNIFYKCSFLDPLPNLFLLFWLFLTFPHTWATNLQQTTLKTSWPKNIPKTFLNSFRNKSMIY